MNTIKIKSTHQKTQGNFVLINESDFDADKHELLNAPKKETAKEKKARLALIANDPNHEQAIDTNANP